MSDKLHLDRNTVVQIIAAVGARADQLPGMEENRDYYCKQYWQYSKWVELLKEQLSAQGIEPVARPKSND